jgi:hypothetical protein
LNPERSYSEDNQAFSMNCPADLGTKRSKTLFNSEERLSEKE